MVGAAAALGLGRLGLRVLVVEPRQADPLEKRIDPRGLALAPATRHVLEWLQAWAPLTAFVQPIRAIHVSEQGRFGFTHLHAEDAALDALAYVCPADQLAATLEAAVDKAVEVRRGARIDNVSAQRDDMRVSITASGHAIEVTARLLVAADGSMSPVRQMLGIDTVARDYAQTAIVANVDVADAPDATAFERFTRQGPLALLPVAPHRHVTVRCVASADAAAYAALSDHDYMAEFNAAFGHRFSGFRNLGERVYHPLRMHHATTLTGARSLLLGAAATGIHPNAAQGLNLGFRDVAELVGSVRRALHENIDIGNETVLADYAGRRLPDQRAVVRFTDTLAQVFSTRLPFIRPVCGIAMTALDLCAPAKRTFIRRAAGLTRLAQLPRLPE